MARSELQREPILQGETEVGTDGSHQRVYILIEKCTTPPIEKCTT